ncbi:MAG TPA: hypothetical protein VGN17_22050 [Bryobacteraceae bacterium]|jgi:hypothetical protein
MKFALIVLAVSLACAETKPLPNQAGNDDIDLAGTLVLERPAVQSIVGVDLGAGYIVVQITATPKTGKPIRLGPDDFVLLNRKNGERSPALDPAQFGGGGGGLVVKPAAQQPGGDGTRTNGPVWGGVQNRIGDKGAATPPPPQLKEKQFPDKESKTPVQGLLYFGLDGKLKPKDVSLIYDGQAGKLIMEFK